MNLPSSLEEESRPESPQAPSFSFTGLPLLLFLFWLSYSFLCFGTDYVFSSVALEKLKDEDSLTSLFGKVSVVSNLVVLVYQWFFATRFVLRFGIYRSILATTLLIVSAWAFTFLYPSLTMIAMNQGIIYFFVENVASATLNTTLNVFPKTIRGRIKVFTEGIGRPAGTVLLFLFATLIIPNIGVEEMKIAMVTVAAGFLLYVPLFHRVYLRHLLKCLHSDDLSLTSNAVQALGEPYNQPAVPPLRSLLAETDSMSLKRTIVLSLGRIQSEEALKDIVNLYLIPNEFMKLAVIKALTNYNNYEAIFALFRQIKFNPGTVIDSHLHLSTSTFLALVGKKMTPFLLEALLHEDTRIRASAIEAIGLLRDHQTIPVLLPFLKDENHRIRVNAAIALSHFRSTRKRALETLDELFHFQSPLEQRSALYGIGVLKLKKYRKALLEMLSSTNKNTLDLVTTALARMKHPKFCPPFVQLLLDPNDHFAESIVFRLKDFPKYSQLLVLATIEKLPKEEQDLIATRLDASMLDVTTTKEMESVSWFS
jgi:HEAT repeat protein